MPETIADIALRLAREQLAAERDDGPGLLASPAALMFHPDTSQDLTRHEIRAGDEVLVAGPTTALDPSGPPWRRGGEESRSTMSVESGIAPALPQRSAAAGDRGTHQLVESISEHGRRLEEVLGELERSLTTLFATQLETFRQLQGRAQEQERRWVEQSANLRATFSPP